MSVVMAFSTNEIITLGGLLTLKHFVFDFLYQPPYQWQNKGTYGHWGGLVHSFQHIVPTGLLLTMFGVAEQLVTLLMIGEFLIHYHMDWFKMKLNKRMGWGPTTHNEFWLLTGFDQLVHGMTYIGIMYAVSNY